MSKLTKRDIKILLDIHRFGYLSLESIARSHFNGSMERARKRLDKLCKAGFLRKTDCIIEFKQESEFVN